MNKPIGKFTVPLSAFRFSTFTVPVPLVTIYLDAFALVIWEELPFKFKLFPFKVIFEFKFKFPEMFNVPDSTFSGEEIVRSRAYALPVIFGFDPAGIVDTSVLAGSTFVFQFSGLVHELSPELLENV